MRHLALICLVSLPIVATAQTQEDDDKGYITTLIEDNLSGDARVVNIQGFAGALSSEATIVRLTVADSAGVWLTLEDVTLSWNRSALLRGAIDVQELSAAKITLARAPLPDDSVDLPAAEATPFALPELPVSIALDELRIDEILLGDVFLGEEMTISLTGSANLADGAGQADVQATRLDGRAGTFQIIGAYSNATQILDLDLDLSEDADGIIARLLDLPEKPSVALTLDGDGPITDYTAALTIATDGAERLAGDLRLTETAAGQQFALDVGGDVTPLFAPDYQTFFGPDVRLQATGMANAAGGFDLSALDVSAQHINLLGEISTDDTGWPEKIDLNGAVFDPTGAPVLLPLSGPQTLVKSVGLTIAYDRTLSDDWTAAFNISEMARPGLFLQSTQLNGGGTIIAGDNPALTANFAYGATGLVLDDVGLAEALGDAISGRMQVAYQSGTPTEISALTLNGPGLEMQASGTVLGPDQGLRTDSNVLLTVTDLSRFATLTGQDLSGEADLTITSTISPLDGFFDVLLSGNTTDLQTGIAQIDQVIDGPGTLSLLALRDTAGTRLPTLRIATDAAEITATADIRNDATDATFDVSLDDIGLVVDGITGPATITGTARQLPGGPLGFDVAAAVPDVALTAAGTLTDNTQLAARVTLNAADLATYRALVVQDIAGAVDLGLVVDTRTDGALFDVMLSGQTQDLQTGIAQLDPLLRDAGTLAAQIKRSGPDAFALDDLVIATPAARITANGKGSPTGPLAVDVQLGLGDIGIIAPGLSGPFDANVQAVRDVDGVTDVDLIADGPGSEISADLRIAADMVISGNAQAAIASLAPYQRLIGQPVRGGVDAVVVGNLQPDLSAFNAEITLRTQDLGIGSAPVDQLLQGAGSLRADIAQTDAGLNVRNLDVSTNNVSLSASLNGTASGGSGQFDARLRDVGLFTDQLSGPATASGTASRTGSTWGIDANLTGPGGIGAQVAGNVRDTGQLNLRVTGNAPLGLANEIIAPRRLSGDATFNIGVNGPAALTSVSGRINVANARLAAPTLSQALEDINGFVSIAGNQAEINVTANVERGGQLGVSGPISLAQPQNADVTVALRDIILKDPTLYDSSIAGQINIRGPLAGGARISGTLELGPSEIQVPSSSLSSLGTLPNVTHIGESTAVRRTLNRADVNAAAGTTNQRTTSRGPTFPLDININAPSRIFIRGRGLDAELGGSLNLGGTTGNVIPVGQFDLIRGRLDILQQRFELSEGTASLQGDFEPFIRLVATTEAATGTVINIVVEGPASAPEVTFESTPQLPQDEVLAQLIFGRNLDEISPLQAVQLASAVSTLAGSGGGGLIDDFRQNIGLDDFDVTTDDEGNAAVRAGAYISENVYTDVTVSSDGSTEVNINLDVTDEITAKGTVDADGETSIGIFFERDY